MGFDSKCTQYCKFQAASGQPDGSIELNIHGKMVKAEHEHDRGANKLKTRTRDSNQGRGTNEI